MHRNVISIENSTPPTIEFDQSVSAWYIRFSRAKVAKTLSEDKPGPVVTIDLDARGKVVGVELIGMKEFSIENSLKIAGLRAPNIDFNKARFVTPNRADLTAA
jgi:uncharacterized protein YuzE